MNYKIQTVLALLLSVATSLVLAHPGPHSHNGIAVDASHAWLGWEAVLILAVFAGAIMLWRTRDCQR